MSQELYVVETPATSAEPYQEEPAEVLTVDEAAKFLRLGRSQLYDAIGRGEIPHQRIGRSIRLSRSALVRWLAGSWVVAEQ